MHCTHRAFHARAFRPCAARAALALSIVRARRQGKADAGLRLVIALIRERAVEIYRGMRAVAKRLVAGLSAAAERHLVGMRYLTAVNVRETNRAGNEIRAIQAGRNRDVRHGDLRFWISRWIRFLRWASAGCVFR